MPDLHSLVHGPQEYALLVLNKEVFGHQKSNPISKKIDFWWTSALFCTLGHQF
jgi:hypothetical protein